MNINEENKDLIENRIPWGLLDEETRNRILDWTNGVEFWAYDEFSRKCRWGLLDVNSPEFFDDHVYRAKPAPTVNKSYPPEVSALISAILEKRLSAQLDGDNSVFEAMVSLISLWDAKRGENE